MVCEQKECERVRVRERGIRSRGATSPPSSMLSMPLGPKEGLKLYETISPSSPSSVAAPRIASELKLPKVLLKVAAKGSFELTCELLLVMVLRARALLQLWTAALGTVKMHTCAHHSHATFA